MLSSLFIASLWSPAGIGLTCGLSFHFTVWYSGSGVILDCIDS